MNKVIKKALQIVGSQKNLANICGVTQPAVHKWLHGGAVSPSKVAAIVKATNGEVQAYQLRPDLPDLFPHPENMSR